MRSLPNSVDFLRPLVVNVGSQQLYLTKETGAGVSGEILWNFTKFLADRDGKVVQRFEPAVTPDSKEVTGAIEKQLK